MFRRSHQKSRKWRRGCPSEPSPPGTSRPPPSRLQDEARVPEARVDERILASEGETLPSSRA